MDKLRALAIYFAIFLLLYGSFIIVEEGVTDIRGQRGDSRALSLSYEDEIIYVIFAGERYELDPVSYTHLKGRHYRRCEVSDFL